MSFLDAYFGYNQIQMDEFDRIHTAFITEIGMFYYKVMPFSLKNARATYQKLINKMFQRLLKKTVEAYIDYMVIKSMKALDHIKELEEVF